MDNHRTVWLSMGFYTMNHLHNTEHNVSMAADWLTLFNAELSPIEKKYWWAPRIQGAGKVEDYQSLHCRHQNDSCIKLGSDGSRFDVSLNA